MAALIPDQIRTLLLAALGSGVPVLLPEEADTPRTIGLRKYLLAHPGGYVQIGQAIPLGRGLLARYWFPVTSLAADAETCAQLDTQVFTALCGVPGRSPGQFSSQLHDPPARATPPDAWVATLTIQAVQLGGALIPGA